MPLIISASLNGGTQKDSVRLAGDEDFLQFRIAPKTIMDRKRNWSENETQLKTKKPKTKLSRNWQICSFGAENENEFRSVSKKTILVFAIAKLMNCEGEGSDDKILQIQKQMK